MLYELIANKNFKEVLIFLQNSESSIDPAYVDQNGNNWVHLVLIAMNQQLKEFYRPFQFCKTVYCKDLEPLNEKSRSLIELIQNIFSLLKQRGCSFSHENSEAKTALDLLRCMKIGYFDEKLLKGLLVFLVKSFESERHCLLSGRKYVTDLALFRGAKSPKKHVQIPDALESSKTALSLHQLLASYEHHLCEFDLGLSAKNLAVATISFVVSSEPHSKNGDHGRRFITIPVYLNNLAVKVEAGRHSEKAMLENLKRDMDLKSQSILVAKLFEHCGNQKGIKVYDAVLDFHSTREVCQDCGTHLREFQTDSSSEGFLSLLAEQLKRSGFVLSTKRQQPLSLVVRASGLDHPSWSGTPDPLVVPPMFYAKDELDRDIRHFNPGVLFHLPPMAHRSEESLSPRSKRRHSDVLGDSDSEHMDQEYKRSRSSITVDVFPFPMGLFTAFANGGGNAKDEVVKEELSSEPVNLSNDQLAQVMSV